MSRTATLWASAILTLALVLVIGSVLLRPSLSRSATAQAQPPTTLLTNAGTAEINVPAQQVEDGHHNDHHDSDGEHNDGD